MFQVPKKIRSRHHFFTSLSSSSHPPNHYGSPGISFIELQGFVKAEVAQKLGPTLSAHLGKTGAGNQALRMRWYYHGKANNVVLVCVCVIVCVYIHVYTLCVCMSAFCMYVCMICIYIYICTYVCVCVCIRVHVANA